MGIASVRDWMSGSSEWAQTVFSGGYTWVYVASFIFFTKYFAFFTVLLASLTCRSPSYTCGTCGSFLFFRLGGDYFPAFYTSP